MLNENSVAEVAQRPLYRVTCGDVGTNAQDVEEVFSMLCTDLWLQTDTRSILRLLCSWEKYGDVVCHCSHQIFDILLTSAISCPPR
jgi:hypothetical protein